jgi:hypothetical protein
MHVALGASHTVNNPNVFHTQMKPSNQITIQSLSSKELIMNIEKGNEYFVHWYCLLLLTYTFQPYFSYLLLRIFLKLDEIHDNIWESFRNHKVVCYNQISCYKFRNRRNGTVTMATKQEAVRIMGDTVSGMTRLSVRRGLRPDNAYHSVSATGHRVLYASIVDKNNLTDQRMYTTEAYFSKLSWYSPMFLCL